jgi:hypothetical protein
MKKAIGIAALLLLLNPVFGFAQERRGWLPNDVAVATSIIQATDSVLIVATWTSANRFQETFEWRVPEVAVAGVQTANWSDSLTVVQPLSDTDAQFCVKTIRDADLKESVETCEPFVIPGVPVLPPDSVNVQIQVAHANVGTARWDTVAGAHQYYASLETDNGLAATFGWNIFHRDAHCVGHTDHRPTGVLNYEGLEIIDVFT